MGMQLRPTGIIRRRVAPSWEQLAVVSLTRAQQPPAEHIELRFGGGFKSVGQIVATLRDVCDRLESGASGGFVPDLEEEPVP